MWKIAALYLIVCSLLFAAVRCFAQVDLGTLTGAGRVAGGGGGTCSSNSYQGPLNVQSGAVVLWSVRAASQATCGNKLMNVCNSTGGTDVGCADLSSSTVNGNLAPTTVSGITCPGTNCTVKTWYDISGNTNCTTSCDVTQSTVNLRPTLDANCINSTLACVHFSGTTVLINSTGFTQAQPYTVIQLWQLGSGASGVYLHKTGSAGGNYTSVNPSPTTYFFTSDGVNTLNIVSGAACNDSAGVANGVSSSANVNNSGSPSTGSAGVSSITSSFSLGSNNSGGANEFMDEMSVYGSALGSTPLTAIHNNFNSYYGC